MKDKRILFAGGAGAAGLLSAMLTVWLGIDQGAFTSWVFAGALDAALIGAALVYLQNYYQSNDFSNLDRVFDGLVKGLIVGAVGGLASYACMNVFGTTDFVRLVGWAISGAAAGYVASLRVPNLDMKVSTIAGGIGASAGCLAMQPDPGPQASHGWLCPEHGHPTPARPGHQVGGTQQHR